MVISSRLSFPPPPALLASNTIIISELEIEKNCIITSSVPGEEETLPTFGTNSKPAGILKTKVSPIKFAFALPIFSNWPACSSITILVRDLEGPPIHRGFPSVVVAGVITTWLNT